MSNTLEVYKGEANENIQIDNLDTLGKPIDLSWSTFGTGESKIEIKNKAGGTILTTLATTDFISVDTTKTIIKGNKIYSLDAGDSYFCKYTASDGSRVKILTFYLEVFDV